MGFFTGTFSRRPVEFANKLADTIACQFPPSSEPQLAKKGAQRRLEGVLSPVMDDLLAFQKEQELGWIGKARLGNAFRWNLTEKGYSKQFVEALTEGVIERITLAR